MEENKSFIPISKQQSGMIKRSKSFLKSAVGSLTGKELPQAVEEFTREMTIVAEGLSEDQAQMKETLRLQGSEQDNLSSQLRSVEQRLSALEKQLSSVEKKANQQKGSKAGLSQILRQATWLAAIIAAAWVITSLVNTFGG